MAAGDRTAGQTSHARLDQGVEVGGEAVAPGPPPCMEGIARGRGRRTGRAHRYRSGWEIPDVKMRLGRPLWTATPPEEGESLVGLVTRATARHVLGDVNGVLRRAGISLDNPGFVSKLPVETLAGLAPIIRCDEREIIGRATPPVRPDAMTSHLMFGDVPMPPWFVETTLRRISPLTLRSNPHHRQDWLVRSLPYCPESLELLVSRCPGCQAALRWKATCGIGVCETCETPVPPSPEAPLPPDLREGYRLFAGLISHSRPVRAAALLRIARPVRDLEPGSIIRLVIALGRYARPGRQACSYSTLTRLPAPQMADLLATGAQLIQRWPGDLQALVHENARMASADRSSYRAHEMHLRSIGSRFRMPVDVATLVTSAFPGLNGRSGSGLVDRTALLDESEASSMIGLSRSRLREFGRLGLIDVMRLPYGCRRGTKTFVDRSVMQDWARRRDASRTFSSLLAITGLPFYAFEQLCEDGTLDVEWHEAMFAVHGCGSITAESFEALRLDLMGRALVGSPADAVPIGTALRRIGGRMKPWRSVVSALKDGSLPFWNIDAVRRRGHPWTRSIRVRRADLTRFDHVVDPTGIRGDASRDDDLSLGDASEILNIGSAGGLRAKAFLKAFPVYVRRAGPGMLLPRTSVLDVAAEAISPAEIGERAGLFGVQVTQLMARHKDLSHPCGWSREGVEGRGLVPPRSTPGEMAVEPLDP